ncbi:septum formation family protein [Solicola gregarius]|uniref:Septum formation family protein n=1 Tax=Solicola gregarius TaxID=2908642 RepID=A0AA46TIC3_9ACTN|nr:septum formation family protein [Solicola gregarius]UYM05736.1 septum formation family protein [Solicola gregarius]
MRNARTSLIVAAALLALSGCASAEDLASAGATDDPTTEATDEPTDEPTEEQTEEPSTPTPSAGDCRKIDSTEISRGAVGAGKSVGCRQPHNAQTFYVADAKGKTAKALTGGDLTKVYKQTEPMCEKQIQAWTGGNAARLARTGYDIVIGTPPAADVPLGAMWVRCDVILYDPDGSVVGLPNDTRGSLDKATSDVDFCVRGSFKPSGTNVVLCDKPHDFRSVGVVNFGKSSDSYPGRSQVEGGMRKPCLRQSRKYLGKNLYTGWTFPTASTWKNGDRYGECYAKTKK